jgi:hypothetical protein
LLAITRPGGHHPDPSRAVSVKMFSAAKLTQI